MLCGFDNDLADPITPTINRIGGSLPHRALHRVVESHVDHPALLDLIERYPSPAQLASVSKKQLVANSWSSRPRA